MTGFKLFDGTALRVYYLCTPIISINVFFNLAGNDKAVEDTTLYGFGESINYQLFIFGVRDSWMEIARQQLKVKSSL